MRPNFLVGLALAVGALTSCVNPTDTGWNLCLGMDGPCDHGPGPSRSYWITGFPFRNERPYDPVRGGAVEELAPGDSETLYLLFGWEPIGPGDTVRAVTWAVTDTTVARITGGADGGGTLVAVAPGEVDVTANRGGYTMWACHLNGCTRISRIRVLAPAASRLTGATYPAERPASPEVIGSHADASRATVSRAFVVP